MNGDPEAPGWLWSGYVSKHKDHNFSRDQNEAIRFCREEDARKAGVGLTKGVRYAQIDPVGPPPWPVLKLT
jgi:hypothetical protein